MRIQKREHSALVVEQDGQQLVFDPGQYTPPFEAPGSVAAIVITHEHADHWTSAHLAKLLAANPHALVYGTAGFAASADEFLVETVSPGERATAGPFELEFLGGVHAPIHESVPDVENLSVFVNDRLLHPGDAFFVPEGREVPVLAVPAGAPWLRIAQVIDWVLQLRPQQTLPIHEMVLSDAGRQLHYARIRWATEQHGGSFHELEPGEWLELDADG